MTDIGSCTIVGGRFGPNDGGYIHSNICDAVKYIKNAQHLYSEGHYPHSNARLIPSDHPLRIIMENLAKLDEEYAMYANKIPDKEKFSTYEPPIENQTRWDKYKGEPGVARLTS